MENSNISTQFANHLFYNIFTIDDDGIEEEVSAIKLGSHADSPVFIRHAQIIHCTGKLVSFSGFTDDLVKPIMVEVLLATVACDCEYMGETYIMIILKTLYMRSV